MKRVFEFTVDHPYLLTSIFFAITIVAAAQLPALRIVADLKLLIPQDRVYLDDEEIRATFGIRDYVIIGLVNEDGVFDYETLAYAESLVARIAAIHEIDRVRSVFSEHNIAETADGLEISPFLEGLTPAEIEIARNSIEAFPAIHGVLVSADLTCLSILAEIDGASEKARVSESIQQILSDNPPPDGRELYVSGMPLFEGVLGEYVLSDLIVMVPVAAVLIVVLLLSAFGSWLLVIIALVEVVVIDVWTVGLMAYYGTPFHIIHATMPVILLALAVADEIHIFSTFYQIRRDASTLRPDTLRTMEEMWKPVILTSITTAAGFLGFLVTSSQPLRDYGLFTACGIFAAMLFSLLLTPAWIVLFGAKLPDGRARTVLRPLLVRFAGWLFKHRNSTLTAIGVVVAIAAIGAVRLYPQDSWIRNFSESSRIRTDNAILNDKLSGTRTLQIQLDTGSRDGIVEPAFLEDVLRFQAAIEANEVVGGTVSLAEIIQKTNREVSGRYAIPDSREAVAQYLLLLDGSSYADLWDLPYQKLRIVVFTKRGDYLSGEKLFPHIEKAAAGRWAGSSMRYGGDFSLGHRWVEILLPNQLASTSTAFVVIFLAAWLTFGSYKKALLVVLPIMLALLVQLGFMGMSGIPLSVTASLFSSIIFGVGVDYAIHLQSRLDWLYREDSPKASLEGAFGSCGEAVMWNGVVMVAGFLTLVVSQMPPTRQLGIMVATGIISSVVATLLLVPPLWLLGKTDNGVT